MDEKVKKAKLSVEDEKQKKMALEKRAEIQLHDSKSNLNLFYRFSHFIQEKELNKQIIWKPFLPFRILSIMISQPQVKSVYKRLNPMFSELYPSSIATQKTIGRWIKR